MDSLPNLPNLQVTDIDGDKMVIAVSVGGQDVVVVSVRGVDDSAVGVYLDARDRQRLRDWLALVDGKPIAS